MLAACVPICLDRDQVARRACQLAHRCSKRSACGSAPCARSSSRDRSPTGWTPTGVFQGVGGSAPCARSCRKIVRRQAGSHNSNDWHQRLAQLLHRCAQSLFAGAHPVGDAYQPGSRASWALRSKSALSCSNAGASSPNQALALLNSAISASRLPSRTIASSASRVCR